MRRLALPFIAFAICISCRRPAVAEQAAASPAEGCWALSPTIFSERGRRVDDRVVTRDTIELRVVRDGPRVGRRMRLHGVRGFRGDPVWRDSAWLRSLPDSVHILWRYDVNAYELRMRVSGDTLTGQSRYLGDIWPAGWRDPRPIGGLRVGCPGRATS